MLRHAADLPEEGAARYNALKRAVRGITNTMLNKCLAELARDGLLIREEMAKKPPHVEYRRTVRGHALLPARPFKPGVITIVMERETRKKGGQCLKGMTPDCSFNCPASSARV